jgi:hypothetical protein
MDEKSPGSWCMKHRKEKSDGKAIGILAGAQYIESERACKN